MRIVRRTKGVHSATLTTQREDIVITGAGLVTSLGLDRESTWAAILRGECGVGPLQHVESVLDPDKGGGEVKEPEGSSPAAAPREVRLLRRALDEALADAGIEGTLPCAPDRCAIVLGTSLHGMRHGGAFLRHGTTDSLTRFLAGATLAAATRGIHADGLRTTTCSACSSGLASIAAADTLLENGEADMVIAGGYDPISEYSYAGFNSMRLVSATQLRPFAASRDGMKVAEGYAVVVLERAGDAAARGVHPLARIAGYGESCDAFHLSKPHPEGNGAAGAIRQAMGAANVEPDGIDMIVAHATATLDNDAAEHAALAQVFGDRLGETPVVGFKSHLGHSLGAAGAVELVLSAMAMRDGVIPACANMKGEPIEFANLRVNVDAPQKKHLRHVLNTSLGFGGANMCMIISPAKSQGAPVRRPAASPSSTDAKCEAVVTGLGVVLPGAVGTEAFDSLCRSTGSGQLAPVLERADYEHLLNARRTRRMSEYAKLCLAAAGEAYRDAGVTDLALFGETCHAVVGTTHGATAYCEDYYSQLIREGVNAANPSLFAEGVPNVASAHLSSTFSLKGFCQTLIGTRSAGLEALHVAMSRIARGAWDCALVVAAEEATELVARTYAELLGKGVPVTGGAVALVLESRAHAEKRGARLRASVGPIAQTAWSDRSPRRRPAVGQEAIARLGPVTAFAVSSVDHPASRWERACLRAARRSRDDQSAPRSMTLNRSAAEQFSVGPLASLAAAMVDPQAWPGAPEDAAIGVVCADWSYGLSCASIRRA